VQLICLLDGTPVYISDPLSGNTHDRTAIDGTPVAEIVQHSGGGIGDKGYQGSDLVTTRKTPKGGELSKRDKESNAAISALRAPVERVFAHFKAWRILHTDYRRSYPTYRDAYNAARGLFFFSIIWGFE
jgi:transposase